MHVSGYAGERERDSELENENELLRVKVFVCEI